MPANCPTSMYVLFAGVAHLQLCRMEPPQAFPSHVFNA